MFSPGKRRNTIATSPTNKTSGGLKGWAEAKSRMGASNGLEDSMSQRRSANTGSTSPTNANSNNSANINMAHSPNAGSLSPRAGEARSASPPDPVQFPMTPSLSHDGPGASAPKKVEELWLHGVKRHLAIVSIDQTGTIISCNNAARVLFGYPVGKLVGTPVANLMPAPHSAVHQTYVDKYVKTGTSMGAIGAWKVRSAVRMDGEQFEVRVALSVNSTNDQHIFSALIDPLFEAHVRTDDKGKILRCSGSVWLLFGIYRDALVGQNVEVILKNPADWFAVKEQVVQCKNSEGEAFTALLRIKREKDQMVGSFLEAPRLRAKFTVLDTGVIVDCSGELKALLGYKPKALKGRALTDLLAEEEVATVQLDKKVVVQMHRRDGRTVFVSLRVTKTKDATGRTVYEAVVKGRHSGEMKALVKLKGQRLRYGGEVFGWYELGPNLGHGMCGPVKRAVHRLTGEEVAIKTLSRERYKEMNMSWPPAKIEIMDRIRHPNLVRMFDTITTAESIFVVMELIDGGEFFEYIERCGSLPEVQARVFWRQLVSGIDYLHRMWICHRDVKLENLVLDNNHNLKLIDFGFACAFTNNEDLDVFCGSPDYAAPELVAAQKYKGSAVDIWAMGVVLYIMVSGYVPFPSPDRIRGLRWDWPPGMVVSDSLTKLLHSIFQPSSRRTSMEQLLIQEWGMDGFSEPIRYSPPQSVADLDVEILAEMEANYGWPREAVVASLADANASSQIATAYSLLEFKKQKKNVGQNPTWVKALAAGQPKGKKQQQACTVQ